MDFSNFGTGRVPDEQVGRIVGAIELAPDWLEQALASERLSVIDARLEPEGYVSDLRYIPGT